jgi:hypothetical protein
LRELLFGNLDVRVFQRHGKVPVKVKAHTFQMVSVRPLIRPFCFSSLTVCKISTSFIVLSLLMIDRL